MSGNDLTTPAGGANWRTIVLVVMALAGLASVVAVVLTLTHANQQRDRALEAQRHSYDVMILARTLSGTIARAEASLGRYVISGDQQLGQLFANDWAAAESQLDRLDRITSDGQQPRIDALRLAYWQRGEELNVIALSTRYHKNDQAIALYYKARYAPTLTAIDTALDSLGIDERGLLDQRTAAAMGSVDRSNRIAGLLGAIGLILVIGAAALGWITVRSLAEAAVAEAEAAAAHDRAEELAGAVETATAELRVQEARLRQVQKMDAVGQLTGGIAHDFNNMLAVVSGGLELAARALTTNPAAARRHIDSAAEGADRAAALTRRLLAFSRQETLTSEAIHLGRLVADMRDLLDRTLGDGVTIALDDTASEWCVRADKVQLENAVLNLAVNARDAMGGRGELRIVTGITRLADRQVGELSAGDYVIVAVADNGCGMTPDVSERVFEPFFTTKEVGKGTGLGLSQVFALVRQLAGDVSIDTAPGRGTTVTLHLPRDGSVADEAVSASLTPIMSAAQASLDVLVIEDDPRVLAATMAALVALGHRPVACDDPLAAPAILAASDRIDLIVSDVLMPRQTGPEMVAALSDRWRAIPVLFVTGFAGDIDAAEFGGRPVLRKPFTLATLERAVAQALIDERPDQIAAE